MADTTDNQVLQEFKQKQSTFRSEFSALKNAKDALLKSFRRKLEEKKIEEVRQGISNTNHN